MRAICINAYNDTPFQQETSIPTLAADEVLIRVHAAAFNPLDALVVSGSAAQFFDITLPLTLSTDFSGTVQHVGSTVSQWQPGDQVICWTDAGTSGGLAEFAAVPASSCVALPESLSFSQGAGIPTAAITAWHALFSKAGLKSGECVLIHAAAGGVGSFAVQFAHKTGARVIATASGEGAELARRLGADEVIDYKSEDFTAVVSDVDVVLDLVGGETQARSFQVLRRGGRLVSTTMPPDQSVAEAYGVSASVFYANVYADQLQALVQKIVEHDVQVVIDCDVPFESFNDAWLRQTSGRAKGKVIVSRINEL